MPLILKIMITAGMKCSLPSYFTAFFHLRSLHLLIRDHLHLLVRDHPCSLPEQYSSIEYNPTGFPATHLAASKAPWAKISLSWRYGTIQSGQRRFRK